MNFRDRYQFNPETDLLGKGGFSRVYKAYDTVRKRNVALKFFHGTWTEKYDMIGEINRMEDVVHPNLIRYYDASIIESVNAIGEKEKIQVGIIEYANYGDITRVFHERPKELIHSIIKEILFGISFLHKHNIAHRDLKPKNILLNKNKKGEIKVKIADFGISKQLGFDDNGASTQLLGSVEYMAPEQFNPTKFGIDSKVSTNLDLWSLGIIIYELFTQNTPFGNRSTGLSNEEILNNILFKNIVIEYNRLEEPYQTMVRRCLVKNAPDRVSNASELLDILESKVSVEHVKQNAIIDHNATQVLTRPSFIDPPVKREPPIEIEKIMGTPDLKQVDLGQDTAPVIRPTFKPYSPPPPPPVFKEKSEEERFLELPKATQASAEAKDAVEVGKKYFQRKDYINSYRYLMPYANSLEFDTESKFYLGFMLYNGKCGGAHDFDLGKKLMDQAKLEDRPMVMDLILKYVLGQ